MKLVVLPLLEVLRPDTVVILGANARTRSYLAWLTAQWLEVVKRPIADRNPFPASGQAALSRLTIDNERRRQFRAPRKAARRDQISSCISQFPLRIERRAIRRAAFQRSICTLKLTA